MRYDDPVDTSRHIITLRLTTGGGSIDPTALYNSSSTRYGFRYRLGGLHMLQRYVVSFEGFRGEKTVAIRTLLSFLTGDDDGVDKLYNLTGIFLVLGISTIIMVVVMVCVGYEKLITRKKDECCQFLCCRRKSRGSARPPPKSSISPEPLVVRDGRGGFDENATVNIRY